MASNEGFAAKAIVALRGLPDIERRVFLAMLDDETTYADLAKRLGITPEEAQRAFAAALVHVADAIDAPPPGPSVTRWLRRIGAVARLARRAGRR